MHVSMYGLSAVRRWNLVAVGGAAGLSPFEADCSNSTAASAADSERPSYRLRRRLIGDGLRLMNSCTRPSLEKQLPTGKFRRHDLDMLRTLESSDLPAVQDLGIAAGMFASDEVGFLQEELAPRDDQSMTTRTPSHPVR